MPTPSYYPANLQWLGLAKETTPGTPMAAPTMWVPVDAPKWVPTIQVFQDTALRGQMGAEYQQIQGLRYDKLSYSTFPYMDTVYQHFLALLGNPDTITGAADPYTHKTSLYNGSGTNAAQPPTFTGFYTDAAGKTWQIPGMVLASLKVAFSAGALVKLDVEWTGLPATAITPPTNTPDANKPWPSWNTTITIGGTAVSYYSDLSLEYKRAAEMIPTITGSQTPFAIFGGEVTVSGDLTAVYQGSATGDLAAYIANTQPVLVVKAAPAGDAVHYLQLTHSLVAYDSAAPEGTTKWMELKSKIRCLTNATDGLAGQSPVQAVFLTATSTAF